MLRKIILAAVLGMFICSGMQAQETDPFAGDPRLAKAVNYQTRGEFIGIITDALSNASGVAIYAGTNSRDWEVRDRKISIFANKLPLGELMGSISRVTGFKWIISGEGSERTYRLVWDDKSRREAQELSDRNQSTVQNTQQGTVEPVVQIDDFFPGYGSLDSLTPQQRVELAASNPFLAWWKDSGMSKTFGKVMSTVPGIAGAVSTGAKYSMSGSQLTPDGRKAALALLNKGIQHRVVLGGTAGKGALRNIRKNLNNATINVNNSVSAGNLSSIQFSYGKWSVSVPIPSPKSSAAATIGKMYTESKQLNRPMKNQLKGHRGDLLRARDADVSAESSANDIQRQASDNTAANSGKSATDSSANKKTTSPADKTTFKASNKPLSMELMRVSKALKVSIVSDWFGDPKPVSDPESAAAMAPDDVLDDIADRYEYTWDKPATASEFRDPDWANKGFLVVPEEWLNKFRKTFTETGKLDIDDLAQMAGLSPEQFEMCIESDSILGGAGISKTVQRNADILRLFAVLSPNERTEVFSNAALDVKMLPVEKIPFAKTAASRNRSFLEKNDIPLLLHGIAKNTGTAVVYELSMFLDGANAKKLNWSIQLPAYKAKPPRTTDTIGPKILTTKPKVSKPKSEVKQR